MNDTKPQCSVCNWTDYEGDWGGCRWIRGFRTVCPECKRHFSGCHDAPILSDPHPFLAHRFKRRNSWWSKFKKKFLDVIDMLGYYP